MKLGTLDNQTRDGRLVVVSSDNKRQMLAESAETLQSALDDWASVSPKLQKQFEHLESNQDAGEPVDEAKMHSPLPRAYEWIDGSAYINHIVLVRKARGAEPPETLRTEPLVYQGGSSVFLRPTQDIRFPTADWGIDFESEVAVIMGDTPMGTKASEASKYIKLVMICNDVSLRNLIPGELKKGFGFFNSKPSSAFSPLCVTPESLGDAWKDGRLHLNMLTDYNGSKFGDPNAGPEMFFGFNELVEHVCRSRAISAGTIIGSGTVSNEDRSRGSSCLAEKRMIEKIDSGEFKTPFMQDGHTVKIRVNDASGQNIFGTIEQKVTIN